ncbi:Tim44 domain-containing protein [Shewanella xiamenensis]|uniref:Tim44-like domain-containing protein n=1 Tax=Shewanella xiamenensis TaxID=332186 RepID=A0ABT6UCH9_9GAMM|nr:Tim44-like domain-containing protein [Shewanella xiamenensis]MDI5832175.1 Tim44-like domain-containing protein [Shewanella xiamenensis]
MKKLFIMLAMIFAVSLAASPVAEAKKFGSNKSIGKSHQTAPAQPAATNTPTTPPTAAPAPAAGKKGMMGGMLGGLLAGGLLAALFMGEGFENIQFMDILIIALLAFVLFKIVRTLMASKASTQPRPAYAGAGQPNPNLQRQQAEQTGFASSANNGSNGFAQAASTVPFHLPVGFDLPSFLEGARSHYKTLQVAWNENDLSKIQEYVSIELFNELSNQRRELVGEQHTEVMFLDAELVRATHNANLAEVSVKYSGRYRDTVEGVEEDIKEIWHLERNLTQANAPWLIVGIEQ